ncbi:MAG: CHAT domain-containing protein [Armatimonadetes bacterium]|nr:CHAT domain-containing protein [Armatimonadota bacterium]
MAVSVTSILAALTSLTALFTWSSEPLQAKTEPKPTVETLALLRDAARVRDPAVALAKYAAIANKAIQAKDTVGEAKAEFACGQKCEALFKWDDARRWLRKAGQAWSKVPYKPGEADALDEIAGTWYYTGHYHECLDTLRTELDIRHAVADRNAEADTLKNLGDTYFRLGEMQTALDYLNRALAIYRDVKNEAGQVSAIQAMANVHAILGELEKSVKESTWTIEVARRLGLKDAEGDGLSILGVRQLDLGNPREAIKSFEAAYKIKEGLRNERDAAINLGDIGFAHYVLGEHAEALKTYQDVYQRDKRRDDLASMISDLDNIGLNLIKLGRSSEALAPLQEALQLEEQCDDNRSEASTLDNVGLAYSELRNFDKAYIFFGRALALDHTLHLPGSEGFALSRMAHALAANGMPDLAITFGKEAVNVYQGMRQRAKGLGGAAEQTYSTSVAPTYRELADLLIKQGRLVEAEEVMDLLKEQETFAFVRGTKHGFEDTISKLAIEEGWWTKWQELEKKAFRIYTRKDALEQEQAKLAKAGKALQPGKAKELAQLEEDTSKLASGTKSYLEAVRKEVASSGNRLSEEADAKIRNAKSVVARLKELRAKGITAAAVYAIASEDTLHYIIVSPSGAVPVSVPIASDKINKMTAELRQALRDPASDPKKPGKALFDAVLRPALEKLDQTGAKSVMWCLDGTLRYVPLGAVWDGEKYLIQRGDFTIFNPLHLETIMSSDRSPTVAAFAATKGGDGFGPLPGAHDEVKRIVKDKKNSLLGPIPGTLWEDSSFTEKNFKLAIEDQDNSLLHVATHFAIGRDFKSSKMLLGDGKELYLSQIADWGESILGHVDLLCLSACDTAEVIHGGSNAGSEIDSFAGLMMDQGAKAVVATLWPVSDESTPLLVERFYINWIANPELGKGQALRKAQLSLLEGDGSGPSPYQHPFYWGPFILIGNWR